MTINLSIRNVPNDVADRLRVRARQNHRSLQGELMDVITRAADFPQRPQGKLTIDEIATWVRSTGLKTPAESVQMIREDRDR